MQTTRPSWQSSECPSWCVVQHAEDDVDGDRECRSAAVEFPAVQLVREWDADGRYSRSPVSDFAVSYMKQGTHDVRPWITVELAENAIYSIEFSPESVERLVDAVSSLLPFARM